MAVAAVGVLGAGRDAGGVAAGEDVLLAVVGVKTAGPFGFAAILAAVLVLAGLVPSLASVRENCVFRLPLPTEFHLSVAANFGCIQICSACLAASFSESSGEGRHGYSGRSRYRSVLVDRLP